MGILLWSAADTLQPIGCILWRVMGFNAADHSKPGRKTMLEPQAETPKILRDFHRRQAKLNVDAGDLKAAEWHGRQAQKAHKQVLKSEKQITPLLGLI